MTGLLIEEIIEAIRQVTGGPCALHEPTFSGKEQEYVRECIQTGWVSSVGAFVDRLERDLAQYTGSRYAVATVNGTAALHAALLLAGVGRNDEVVVPALSFVATANAVTYCGAIPHFADVSSRTLGLDPEQLASHFNAVLEFTNGHCRNRNTGRRVAGIVPMHTFGHPCEIDRVCELATKYGLPVIEDAAESLGSSCQGRHTGTFGRFGILSFNGNKIVTSGGGGAILTNDENLARRAKHLTTTARVPHRWGFVHDVAGFNYRMPNLNAALACAQLEQLPGFLRIKRLTAERYQQAFAAVEGIDSVVEPEGCESNYWLNAVRLKSEYQALRDEILEATNAAGLMTRPCWTPLNRLPMYQECPAANLEVTDVLFEQLINLPSGVGLARARN